MFRSVRLILVLIGFCVAAMGAEEKISNTATEDIEKPITDVGYPETTNGDHLKDIEYLNKRIDDLDKDIDRQYSVFGLIIGVITILFMLVILWVNIRREGEYKKLSRRLSEAEYIIQQMRTYLNQTEGIVNNVESKSTMIDKIISGIEKSDTKPLNNTDKLLVAERDGFIEDIEELIKEYDFIKTYAHSLYEVVKRETPLQAELIIELGEVAKKNNNYSFLLELVNILSKTVESNLYNNKILYAAKGFAYFETGQYTKAIKAFREVTFHDPENAVFYNIIGEIYIEIGDYSKAVKEFTRAIKIRYNYTEAFFDRARAFGLWGRQRDMIDDLNHAITMFNKHGGTINFREQAKTEKAFAPYIDDPDFRKIVFPEEAGN